MSFCANCGEQMHQGQSNCTRCGAPVAGPPAADRSGGRRTGRRLRIILVAAVAVIALAAAGTVWATRGSDGSLTVSVHPFNDVQFAGKPSLQWKRSINEVARIDCSTTTYDYSPGRTHPCSVQGEWLSPTSVLITVSNDKSSELIGLDRKTGDRKWSTRLPGTASCLVDSDIAWCTSTGSGDEHNARPIELTTVDPASGKKLGRAAVPGTRFIDDSGRSGAAAHGFGYFVGSTETSPGSYQVSVVKMDSHAEVAWHVKLPVRAGKHWSTLGQVYGSIEDGRVYLIGAESGGKQVILDDATGAQLEAGRGHVVGFTDDAVISQRGTSGLQIGTTHLSQTELGGLYAVDRHDDLPLIVAGGAGKAPSFTAVDMTNPAKTLFHVSGYRPLAYCGGTLYAAKTAGSPYGSGADGPSMQVEALNPTTGKVKWHKTADGYTPVAPYGAVRCNDGGLILGGPHHLMKLDRRSGKADWKLALAHNAQFDYGQEYRQSGILITGGGAGHLTIGYLH